MGFDDRRYGGGTGGGGFGGGGGDLAWKIWRALNYNFSIGNYAGIDLRVHIIFVIFVAFRIIDEGDAMWTLRWTGLLFMSVILHEFGHALACRSVGGHADTILIWPLGGLAFCLPPRRPWPEFVTVIWGPMVNVILGAAAWTILFVWVGLDRMPVSFDPFNPWTELVSAAGPFQQLVADFFVVNYILLLFNLALVFYPFDGGRIVQIALWTRIGFVRSMSVATVVGMIGAVCVAFAGLALRHTLLVLIGIFGFYACYQQQRAMREMGPEAMLGGYEPIYEGTKPAGPGPIARWRTRRKVERVRREAAAQRELEVEVDRVLDKVAREGIHSLSDREKRTLKEATERQRNG